MNILKKNDGFSLIELIIAVAICLILTGFSANSAIRTFHKSKESRYIAEAVSVYKAIELCLIEKVEEEGCDIGDIHMDIMDQMDAPNHVLRPYLSGNITKNAQIKRLRLSTRPISVGDMEYMVDKYVIEVRKDGTVTVLVRPSFDTKFFNFND